MAKVDRERLQVTEWVRRKIGELRAGSNSMTFREIGKLWGVSNAWVTNLHNRRAGVVGPQLERTIAELYFGGSVDELRREARKIEIGEEGGGAEPLVERTERYPNLAVAAAFALRDADEARRPFVEQAVEHFRQAALKSDNDLSPREWLDLIGARASQLRLDALDPARVMAREEADQARTDEAKKSGRAGWGRGKKP